MSKYKLELSEIFKAIKRGDVNFYDNLSEDLKKDVSFYTLPRYISCPTNPDFSKKDLEELHGNAILAINQFYNTNYFDISKHHTLLWKLLVACGKDTSNFYKKTRFNWIPLKKKSDPSSKKLKLLQAIYPNLKYDDLETLEKILTNEEFRSLVDEYSTLLNEQAVTQIYTSMGWKKKK